MVGLHRAYNSSAVVAELMGDEDISCSFYEDLFLDDRITFHDAVAEALKHTSGNITGIELDLDCIAGVLSSAATPAGISVLQARQYIRECLNSATVAYIHLTEGAVALRDGRTDNSTAKLVAYLLYDVLTDTGQPGIQ
jgi:formiminoglutamase